MVVAAIAELGIVVLVLLWLLYKPVKVSAMQFLDKETGEPLHQRLIHDNIEEVSL